MTALCFQSKIWLLCLRTPHIFLVTQIATTILYFPIVYWFVNVLDGGVVGLGLAFVAQATLQWIVITVWMSLTPKFKEAIFLPRADSFEGWGEYLSLSIPGTIMICGEWWAWLIVSMIAGLMGVTELAA